MAIILDSWLRGAKSNSSQGSQDSTLIFRYQILAPTAVSGGFMDGKKACEKLLDAMQLEKASYRVGTSKVMDIDL